MKIVLIGAGNVATHLGQALQDAGHKVVQTYSRTMASATALASKLGCKATTSIDEVCRTADLYVISLVDKAVESLLPQLCTGREQATFVHTSGSLPMGIFHGFAAHYGVIYPMQTFSKCREIDFSAVPFFVEGSDEETLSRLKTLCSELSDSVKELDSKSRRALHIAAVFACNFPNHCFHIAERLLEENGIDFSIMFPLIDETVAKVHTTSPFKAQTGPAVRYDTNIIDAHLQQLEDHKEWKQLYELMSKDIHKTHDDYDKL